MDSKETHPSIIIKKEHRRSHITLFSAPTNADTKDATRAAHLFEDFVNDPEVTIYQVAESSNGSIYVEWVESSVFSKYVLGEEDREDTAKTIYTTRRYSV